MSRNLSLPFFPLPPQTYDPRYMAMVIRSFSTYLEQQLNPGEGRHTRLVLTDLPSNDVGLEAGSLFESDGFVKISRLFNPHPAGVALLASVGTVNVTTS